MRPALLKAGATLPHLLASALISLVGWAALPDDVAVGVLLGWLTVSVALACGRLDGPAVRVLWRARPPTPTEARHLAEPWQHAGRRADLTGLILWVGGTGYPAFAAGPHHLVLSHPVVDEYLRGRLTTNAIAGLICHAAARHHHGRPRFDLLVGFWTAPWDLLRGVLLGIGRRLAWIPLVAFAWRVRLVVATIAVIVETQEGRLQTAIIIATFITLTYLTPACRGAWEQHLAAAAATYVARNRSPVCAVGSFPSVVEKDRRPPGRGCADVV